MFNGLVRSPQPLHKSRQTHSSTHILPLLPTFYSPTTYLKMMMTKTSVVTKAVSRRSMIARATGAPPPPPTPATPPPAVVRLPQIGSLGATEVLWRIRSQETFGAFTDLLFGLLGVCSPHHHQSSSLPQWQRRSLLARPWHSQVRSAG